ncbi:hypothetical protein L1987_06857 [Smallanthus sonchifolius]|uniref:Uncharacterized protein n=1 Tax=Smallanthus sonchifolius TaxID=185202 RepID=A0ACB9JZB2_9ASTR|nr:hypothetical protein L1987_06857 [Smallanthus sonchifolius]
MEVNLDGAAEMTLHEEHQPHVATSVAPAPPINALNMFDNLIIQVRDLLTSYSAFTNKLEIRSYTSENGLSLPVATIHSVKSTADVLNLMKSGIVNRAVSSTLNHQRSWSHRSSV